MNRYRAIPEPHGIMGPGIVTPYYVERKAFYERLASELISGVDVAAVSDFIAERYGRGR